MIRRRTSNGASRPIAGWTAALGILIVLGLMAPALAAGSQDSGRQAVVEVDGMACPFCAYGIRKHLLKLPGAEEVRVELAEGQAIIDFEPGAEVTDEQIQNAVRDAGFGAANIEWRSSNGATDDRS